MTTLSRSLLLACCLTLVAVLDAATQQPVPPPNTQALTIPLTPPEEAARRMTPPPGFRVSLFAAEPDVQQPIALATDARGRLWVAENYTYAEQRINFDRKLRDRLVILEDTDHDGRYDRRTVFWDGGQLLTSVEVGFGGVWVLCAPRLLFIPDRNGDDVPDSEPVVMLDGFNDNEVRHNLVNGLHWGPDGWLYGRHGIMASSTVGKPGTPLENRVTFNCAIWRFHPTRHVFEIVAQGTTNPWGHDWDEHGELFFTNTVIGHLWHAVPGAHFQRMYGEDLNPYVYQLLPQTADHYNWDTGKAWTDSRDAAGKSDGLGGGHAHSGCLIYQGDNWPAEYRGKLLTLNFHGRRINVEQLERQGASYVGRRIGDRFKTSDPWFRGIELVSGPDGGVFVADWSDIGECHQNDGVHRTSGRIFKLTHGQPKRPTIASVAALDDLELIRLQDYPNDWYARHARLELQGRAAAGRELKQVHAVLRERYGQEANVTRKLRLLWCLHATGGLDEQWLLRQLAVQDEHVRVWAIRLLVDGGPPSIGVVKRLTEQAALEQSGLVLLYLASALQRLPLDLRWPLAEAISQREEWQSDPVLPLMVWYGIEPAVPVDPARAVNLAGSRLPLVRQFIARRLTSSLEKNPQAVARLVKLLSDASSPILQRDILTGMSVALQGRRKVVAPPEWSAVAAKLRESTLPEVRQRAAELSAVFGDGRGLEDLRRLAADKAAGLDARRNAIRALVDSRADGVVPLLQSLMGDRDLAPAVVRGLAAFDAPETLKALLTSYRRLAPSGREEAISTLSTRPAWAKAMLSEVKSGRIPRPDIPVFQVRHMRTFKDADLERELLILWPELRNTSKEKAAVIAKFRTHLTSERLAKADLMQGRQIFAKSCATCHRLFGEGSQIGPDLTGGDRRNLNYLLENIVDPSATVTKDFRLATLTMKDGRVLSGVLGSKTERTIALQTPTARVILDQADIEDIQHSDLSLMPEGLLEAMREDEARDLIGYLMSGK